MEVLDLQGVRFIKASKAAREYGYTSDYVGQLCRSGAVRAERVGRGWFVHEDDIKNHKKEKKRVAKTKPRASLVRSAAIVRKEEPIGIDEHTYRSRLAHSGGSLRFTDDNEPLRPQIKKTKKHIPDTTVAEKVDRLEPTEISIRHEPEYIDEEEYTTDIPVYVASPETVPLEKHTVEQETDIDEVDDVDVEDAERTVTYTDVPSEKNEAAPPQVPQKTYREHVESLQGHRMTHTRQPVYVKKSTLDVWMAVLLLCVSLAFFMGSAFVAEGKITNQRGVQRWFTIEYSYAKILWHTTIVSFNKYKKRL